MVRMLVVVAVIAACGSSSSKPAGAVCQQDSECDADLMCLELGQFSGSGSACTPVGKVCTKTCTTVADCGSLGSNFLCFASCGSAMVCGATGSP